MRGAAIAGLAIGLSFLVKQTGIILAVPLAVYAFRLGVRPAVVLSTLVLAIVGGTTAVLQGVYDGWYLYYVFQVPKQHPLAHEMLWGFCDSISPVLFRLH